jgi:uracil-DNA glycosylase family 4
MSNSISREDILRELELLPVWRPKMAPLPKTELAKEADNSSASLTVETSPIVELKVQVLEPDAITTLEPTIAENAGLPAETALPITGKGTIAPARAEAIQNMDWAALQDCIKECQACELAASRTKTVFGAGDPNAEWLFVGEAPDSIEDQRGEPFAGQAGKLLDNILIAMQLRRGQNVFVTNVLKCRMPDHGSPLNEEVLQCDPYLKQQIALIKPKRIVALGQFAAQSLLQTDAPIANLRSHVHQYNDVPVVVTFHPADLLRNPEDKPKAWDDLCLARQTMQALPGHNP